MPETQPQIIGLEKELVDPGTGAPAKFHVVRHYSVNLHGGGSSSVTFAGYISRDAFNTGKSPLMHVTLQLNVIPSGDSAEFPHWFARQLLDTEATHDLSGATPAYAELPPAAEEATA